MSSGTGPATQRSLILMVIVLSVLCCVLLVRTFKADVPFVESSRPAESPSAASGRRVEASPLDPTLALPELRSTVTAESTPVTPAPHVPEPYYPPKDPVGRIAEDLRHDIEKLRELKLFGTAERIVARSTYLREDLLGRSYLDPVPPEVMKNLKTFATLTGPGGARTYVFTPDEYPLYTEMKGRAMKGEDYENKLDDQFVEQVVAYAEETLAWIPKPPR